jgi:NAD(P)-dependent dehydrogenase (short-subunit alcohol dehydrogenase family)
MRRRTPETGEAKDHGMRTRPVETALITGAGSGMGRAAARALCRAGIRVVAADVDLKAAEETAAGLEGLPGRTEATFVDVGASDSVQALFEELKRRFERLDLLVHTAAIMGETRFIEDIGDEEWRRLMAVNVEGTFTCCREAVRWMKAHQTGRILLFSSVAALTPTPGALPYSASKGAVTMLGRTLAGEVARHNIRVNVIAPGYIRTPMLAGLPDGFADRIIKKTPLGRLGEPEEIAALVAFLASPEADFITGQVISPNGGLVI